MFESLTDTQLAKLRDKIDSGERKLWKLDSFLLTAGAGYSNLAQGVLDAQLEMYRLGTDIRDVLFSREKWTWIPCS